MDDQKIYQHLARKPGSRAQDIADALDVDLKDASEALRGLVDVGNVVRHSGAGPNGLPAQLYNLTDSFKKTREGVALLAAAAGFKDAAPVQPVVVPVFAQSTTMPALESIKTTKVERAIAHVEKGPASDDEMRIAMGIEKPAAPAAYLVSAIKSGKIHKGEKGWTKGRAPGSSTPFSPPISTRKDEPKAQFGPTAQPEDPKPMQPEACKHDTPFRYECDECLAEIDAAQPTAKAAAADQPNPFDDPAPAPAPVQPAEAPIIPVFRCGLWSDGVLELQRNGVAVATLNRGEHEHLADFMRRMLGAVEQVAA